MPDRIIRAQAHKPTKQQALVELLQQQTLRADAEKRLHQSGQQQLFRRNRGPIFCGIQRTEGGIESIRGQIRRSGWLAGMRPSIETLENREPLRSR
jgi:hypothetical protein